MLKRVTVFVYALICYALFFCTFLYAIGFVTDLYVPRALDAAPTGPFGESLAVDLALLGLFAVQHSGMARMPFKRWITRFIPEPAERSTYVLMASLALIVLFRFWRPLGGSIWEVSNATARTVLFVLGAAGWLTVLVSTFLIDHFDLFGLRQAWCFVSGREYHHLRFRTPGPYRLTRHPLYLGFLFAFWSTPHMTLTHLLFAAATTGYILIAIPLEERDLVTHLGDEYRQYRGRVPMLIPFTRR